LVAEFNYKLRNLVAEEAKRQKLAQGLDFKTRTKEIKIEFFCKKLNLSGLMWLQVALKTKRGRPIEATPKR
jgi:hypothetical protein